MNDSPTLSFSMIIDDEVLEGKINKSKKKGSNENLKEMSTLKLEKRSILKWEKDDSVTNCRKCNFEFGYFLMKHHCRLCGRIYCHNCADKFIDAPKNLELPKANKTISNLVVNSLGLNKHSKIRVCSDCFSKNNEIKKCESLMKVFDFLEIGDINRSLLLSKTWHKAGTYYLSQLREVQYKLPFHHLSDFDKNSLWVNRNQFIGHSIWIKMLIRSIDQYDTKKVNKIIKLLSPDRKNTCMQMMCSRTCQPILSPEDVIELLEMKYINPILEPFLMTALFRSQKQELMCYSLQIINYLVRTKSKTVLNFLLKKIEQDFELVSTFYFDFNIICNLFPQFTISIKEIKETFIKKLPEDIVKKIKMTEHGLTIIEKLKNINNTDDLKVQLSQISNEKFMLPVHPNQQFNSFDSNSVEVKESFWKPIVLKLMSSQGYNSKILLKKEDVVKDYIINKIISLMDFLIRTEENTNCHVVKYHSYPLKSNLGIIEIVDEADTIFNITSFKKFTIQNFIMEQNPNETVQEIRNRFTRSTAAYCVITFLLGIGDRHLDNIMVHNSGSLFHIDYGYILGTDPKLKDPFIRITPGMLDAMGGEQSENYILFKKLCNSIYSTMRRHQNIIITLISFLRNVDPKKYNNKLFEKHILKRFEPGLNFKDAENHLYKIMEKSHNNSWKLGVVDFLHSSFRHGYKMLKPSGSG